VLSGADVDKTVAAGGKMVLVGRAMLHGKSSTNILMALAAAIVCAMIGPCVARAGTVSGTISGRDGKPITAAMITVSDTNLGLAESVFSDAKGKFVLETRMVGDLTLRVRKPYMRDLRTDIHLEPVARKAVKLTLERMRSDQEISDSLPAAYHFGHIPFQPGTPFDRRQFQRDCLTCHQLGNPFTRLVMPADAWSIIVKQMHGWLGNFDEGLRDRRAQLLASGFDGKPLTVRPQFPTDPLLARAKITQYRLDQAVVPHDAEVSPIDGLVYTADEGADQMAITNLQTAETHYVKAPPAGSPPGGKFGSPPLFNLLVARGPHSLALGPDNKWYVTDAFAGAVAIFNPMTMQWEPPHDIGGKALYPHTIRFDREGVAWFTIAYSDQIGRFNPQSGKIDVIELPPLKPTGIAAMTVPYGIDVNPIDGTVWYARLYGDKIGRIDPHTLAITEFDSPVKGPRRLRFDTEGNLWVAGFSDGELARIETAHFKSKVYKLPEFAPGYAPAVYALAIDPQTQDVWINEIMTDHIYRFLRKEERFVAYPMPLRGTYTRDVSFTSDGRVCMSNNPVPKAALEGGIAELICIDPEGAVPKHVQ
jgi:streptogramin lyase